MRKRRSKIPVIKVWVSRPQTDGKPIDPETEYQPGVSFPSRNLRFTYAGYSYALGVVDCIPKKPREAAGNRGRGARPGKKKTRPVPLCRRASHIIGVYEPNGRGGGEFKLNQKSAWVEENYLVPPTSAKAGVLLNNLYWAMAAIAQAVNKSCEDSKVEKELTEELRGDEEGLEGYTSFEEYTAGKALSAFVGSPLVTTTLERVRGLDSAGMLAGVGED